ncbi:MAG: 50S ribosomal protein L9 [Deltaproteobacteria bacterium]|nr:50S ribosomal protein L9 [Deltaproteobacteria bacterium]
MRVILKEEVENLGEAGQVVEVRPGYGRNFLLPNGLALVATDRDVARFEHERRVIAAKAARLKGELEAKASALSALEVRISRTAGEGDKLYGSVNNRDIAAALLEKGMTVDPRKILLAEPIKTIGTTEVKVKLGQGIVSVVKVHVVAETA